jgi:hypothetical protein
VDLLGVALTGACTGGGVWFVVRLIVRFQRDFTDRYAARIVEQDAHIDRLESENDDLKRRLIGCATERGALRAVVRQHGLEWDPTSWRVDDG